MKKRIEQSLYSKNSSKYNMGNTSTAKRKSWLACELSSTCVQKPRATLAVVKLSNWRRMLSWSTKHFAITSGMCARMLLMN